MIPVFLGLPHHASLGPLEFAVEADDVGFVEVSIWATAGALDPDSVFVVGVAGAVSTWDHAHDEVVQAAKAGFEAHFAFGFPGRWVLC